MMKLLLFASALALACAAPIAHAQEGPGKFDPVVYMKSFSMGEIYSGQRFLSVETADASFENYLIDKADILAFTIKQQAKDSTGWTMWLDFTMDRLGSKRLTRISARKVITGKPDSVYAYFTKWMNSLLDDKMGKVLDQKTDYIKRLYEKENEYILTVQITPRKKGEPRYIMFTVDPYKG